MATNVQQEFRKLQEEDRRGLEAGEFCGGPDQACQAEGAGLTPGMSGDNTTAIRLSAADYAFHRHEAIRLRARAKTAATVKARLLQKAEEHARLAGLTTYHGIRGTIR
jgi:hypothetical protein